MYAQEGTLPDKWADLGHFPKLTSMNLSRNELTGTNPYPKFLKSFGRSGQRYVGALVSGTIPKSWAGYCHLAVIDLHGNHIAGQNPKAGDLLSCAALYLIVLIAIVGGKMNDNQDLACREDKCML